MTLVEEPPQNLLNGQESTWFGDRLGGLLKLFGQVRYGGPV
jgi:hypothetical protein